MLSILGAPGDNEDEDEDGDENGAWDDGRDTDSGDPRDSPYYHTETVVKRWTETIEKGPLLSTYWHQGFPYNKTIEKFEGVGTRVDCVAIAIGQIMNYNRKNNLKNYNWDKINVINGHYPTTDHLPDFLRDVAEGVHMEYGTTGSSSNFGKAVSYFNKAGYSQRQSLNYDYNIFKKCIDNNKPIYISGSNERKGVYFIFRWGWKYKGYAWVADGYKTVKQMERVKIDRGNIGGISYQNYTTSLDYIHMNWGWGKHNRSQLDNGGWCTYNYFKIPNYSEFKWNKKMIIY